MNSTQILACIHGAVTPQQKQDVLQLLPASMHNSAKLTWRIPEIQALSGSSPNEKEAYLATVEPENRWFPEAMWAPGSEEALMRADAMAVNRVRDAEQEFVTFMNAADQNEQRIESERRLQADEARRNEEIAASAAANARRLDEAQSVARRELREQLEAAEYHEQQRRQDREMELRAQLDGEADEQERQRLEAELAVDEDIAETEDAIRLLEDNLKLAMEAREKIQKEIQVEKSTMEAQSRVIKLCDERIAALKVEATQLQEQSSQLESDATVAEVDAETAARSLEVIADAAGAFNVSTTPKTTEVKSPEGSNRVTAVACALRITAAGIRMWGKRRATELRRRAANLANRASMLLGAETQQHQTRRSDADNTIRQCDQKCQGKEAELRQRLCDVNLFEQTLSQERTSLVRHQMQRAAAFIAARHTTAQVLYGAEEFPSHEHSGYNTAQILAAPL